MARVKTFTNGGSLLPSDLDTIEDDYECAFGTYKVIGHQTVLVGGSGPTLAGTYIYFNAYGSVGGGTTVAELGSCLYLDPARFWSDASTASANPRVPQYNVSISGFTNGTAAGTVTYTTGLYQVTGVSAGALTLAGTPVTGSTVAITNPTANDVIAAAYSGDFAGPTAGMYTFAVVVSANAASASEVVLRAELQMRQI